MEKISILIIDDHKLLREILGLSLQQEENFDLIGSTENIQEAYSVIALRTPSVVLLDINMPGETGFEIAEKVLSIAPKTRIIAITMCALPVYAKRMFKLGASGYITKNSSHAEVVQAINKVVEGQQYVCDEIRNMIVTDKLASDNVQKGVSQLTKREIEIIASLKRGLSSKEIASELCLSARTVEVHRYKILRKLELKNVASLVGYAHTIGL